MKINYLNKIFIAAIYICITSCSGQKVKQNSTSAISTDAQLSETSDRPLTNGPKALNPDSSSTSDTLPVTPFSLKPMSGAGAVVALALAGTAIGLSQVFQSSEVSTDLNGKCVYGSPEAPIESPCIQVTVNLLNEQKKILSSSTTNRSGDFRFYIPENQSFYVQVIDRKGREATTKVKVGRSEYVSLYLKP